jgi:hypothetical protein
MSADPLPSVTPLLLPPKEVSIESIIPVPVIVADSRSFDDSLLVSILPVHGNYKIYYTIDNREPSEKSTPYKTPFYINNTATVKAIAIGYDEKQSMTALASFYKKQNNYTVQILSKYQKQYSAGGDNGLIDGIRGDINWRKGDWQGYQGQDFEAIINLNDIVQISEISVGFLQDTRAWILMPLSVEYYISDDGINFLLIGVKNNFIADKDLDVQTSEFTYSLEKITPARYIKIKAINYGKLPSWHQGSGYQSYIFIDEINIR